MTSSNKYCFVVIMSAAGQKRDFLQFGVVSMKPAGGKKDMGQSSVKTGFELQGLVA